MAFSYRGVPVALGVVCMALAAFGVVGADDRPAVQLSFDGTDGRVVFDAAVEGRNPGCRPVGAVPVPGVFGEALAWNGAGSLELGRELPPCSARTVAVWVKTSDDGAGRVLCTTRGKRADNLSLSLYLSEGRPHWVLTGDNLLIGKAATRSVADGSWHHVTGVFSCPEGTAITPACFAIYIDGRVAPGGEAAQDGRALKPVSPVVERAGVTLMYDAVFAASGYEPTPRAAIDDFRIYLRALSGIEVAALAAPGQVAIAGAPEQDPAGGSAAPAPPGKPAAPASEALPTIPTEPKPEPIVPAPAAPAGEVQGVRIFAPAQVAQTDLFQVRVLVPPALRRQTDKYFFGGALVAGGEVEPDPFAWSLEPSPALQYPAVGERAEVEVGIRLYSKDGPIGGAATKVVFTPVRLVGAPGPGWEVDDRKDRCFHARLPRTFFGPAENQPLVEGELHVAFRGDVRATSLLALRRLVERELGLKEDDPSLRQISVAGFTGYGIVEPPEIGYAGSGFVDFEHVQARGARVRGTLLKGRAVIGITGGISCGGGRWSRDGQYTRDDTRIVRARANDAYAQLVTILNSVSLQRGGE